MKRILLSILLLATVILTCAIAEQSPAAGWCRVYLSPDRSELRFFYEDGRYGWLAADAKRRKDGTYSASEHEDYTTKTGTWKMSGGEIESHAFWVRVPIKQPMGPVDEHYSLSSDSTLQTARVLHLRDPATMMHRSLPAENLMFIELDKVKDFQHGLISDTCDYAKKRPDNVAQAWMKFCTQ